MSTDPSKYLWIVVLMGCGAWALYWRKKRKFDRTNDKGIEIYPSYGKKMLGEAFDKLLLWIGYVCITVSVWLILSLD
jgi:hypothetical protein